MGGWEEGWREEGREEGRGERHILLTLFTHMIDTGNLFGANFIIKSIFNLPILESHMSEALLGTLRTLSYLVFKTTNELVTIIFTC